MKLLNWQFQYWHFNEYFILCTSTGVIAYFHEGMLYERKKV